MNARYNGYYYSNDNLKESVKKVEKANKDDFSKIIPLFIYTDNQNSKNYYSDFDKTIKKSSTVIQRHAIKNKRTKEEIVNACKWIDENYMLIGKAHFYKRDLFSALEAFEYVSKKYPNPEAKYGAILWMIRTDNEIGSFSLSETMVDDIRYSKDFPKKKIFQREFALVAADFYIKRGDYNAALKQLTRGIMLTRKKTTRARYNYVLAQLYEKQGDNKKASQYFNNVLGLHPSYDMAFSAQINMAKLYDMESGDSKPIKKQLMKLLRDDKNIEFRDQIYYALAQVAEKEKDIPLAINYLGKSIKESTSNNTQKALSYLKRADIYFDKLDYKTSQANYDSALGILPKDYPDYDRLNEKKKSLTALVINLNTIALEDSLQHLAQMSEKDRNNAIEKLITKVENEEKKKEEEKQTQLTNLQNTTTTTTTQNTSGASTAWYFYNPATVSFGVGEFSKKWGSRKLEDNWRRTEKDQIAVANTPLDDDGNIANTSDSTKGTVKGKNVIKNKKDKNYYLQKIPLTPEAVANSNNKIIDAYYNAGSIYKEQILNFKKSNETFEELLKRYPDNKYKLSTYYQLYRTYLSQNNETKAEYYKNLILTEFADTEYAKIIKNPDYAKDIMASKSEVERFYTKTFELYSEAKYVEALANCQEAENNYSKSNLIPQFSFIKALCIGRTQDINAFESALTQVVIKYPKEPVKDKAQEILDAIKKQKNKTTNTNVAAAVDTTQTKSKFIFKEDGDYYWVTIVENGKGDINKFKTKLSDLNTESFGTQDLNISSIFLDLSRQLISVKTFNGKGKAMDYYMFMKNKNDAFKDLQGGTYQSFIISAENYATFYKEKNVEEYQQFFTQKFK